MAPEAGMMLGGSAAVCTAALGQRVVGERVAGPERWGGGHSACRRVPSCAGLLTSQVARIQGGRVAEFDKAICEYIDASYHDGVGGDSATGVRWWILFICRGLGEDARRVLGPDASLDAKLREELVVLRFVCWLVEVRGVTPETARKYVSTVQAWHERRFGIKLAGGLKMARLPAMLKGMVRSQGGRRPRKLRKGVRPRVLQRAMAQEIGGTTAWEANWVACCTTGFCGLLRAAEMALGPGKRWAEATCLTRADVTFHKRGKRRWAVLMMRPCKNDKVEQGKRVPLLLPAGGRYLDAYEALRRLFERDPVPESEAAGTPLFRDPATGAAFTTRHVRAVVKTLMASVGEDPALFGAHSLRIGGATAALAKGVPPVVIRAMGRWSSDIYEVYCRATEESVLRFGVAIGSADFVDLEGEYHHQEF